MADPVSWLMIEPGWRVVDARGEELGHIEAVTGDSNADIFDGLSIASGMLARPKYVPAEQVGEITQGTVQLLLDKAAFDALGEYDEPAEPFARPAAGEVLVPGNTNIDELRDAYGAQLLRGHRADAPERLDRQLLQEALDALGRDDGEPVGLFPAGGDLGEELVRRHAGRGGEIQLFSYFILDPARDVHRQRLAPAVLRDVEVRLV